MHQHYILVEGINLYANIYDTDQLSVIRGSSFLYKNAIDELRVACDSGQFQNQLKPLTTGASSGLFQLLTPNEGILGEINKLLKKPDAPWCLLTFAVVATEAENLQAGKEKLYAQLRWQQLQSLTLKPDQLDLAHEPCELSGSRIASNEDPITIQGKKRRLSESVFLRWRNGRDEKQSYYQRLVDDKDLLQKLKVFQFANDIEALCTDTSQALNNKMAVFYADGNNFGSRQQKFIEHAGAGNEQQIESQRKFDENIQGRRKDFLTDTLSHLLPEQADKTIRLETLLWGGDEMLFVMPAWEGFAFLQRFFEFNWHLPDGENGADKALTHAAGIVFCQANTPIRIIQTLARELAEKVKDTRDTADKKIGRESNGWDYLVLESVDYPTNESLDDYFTERYGEILAGVRHPHSILEPIENWSREQKQRLSDFLYGDKENRKSPALSRGQLYQVVQTIKKTLKTKPDALDKANTAAGGWQQLINPHDVGNTGFTPIETAEQRLYQVSENQDALTALKTYAEDWFKLDIDQPEQRAWLWIHLQELWDYLIPQAKLPKTESTAADDKPVQEAAA